MDRVLASEAKGRGFDPRQPHQPNDRDALQDAGRVTAEIAKSHAENEFDKYRILQDRLPESEFDQVIRQIESASQPDIAEEQRLWLSKRTRQLERRQAQGLGLRGRLPSTEPMIDRDQLASLQSENARLIALLDSHGIEWRLQQHQTPPEHAPPVPKPEPSRLSTAEKVALFRRLFRGRTDVYPIRWESKTTGNSGYAPACGNEWLAGICEKPRIKCGECNNRLLIPLSDQVIFEHLAGKRTVGVYPLLSDDTCHFLAADFDEAQWREDAKAFYLSCIELGVPVVLEISRSGNGAHTWIFFTGSVSARDARRLGTAIISHTCARTRQLKLESYDRLFPNQDAMPKGGFGNLIALPLQKLPRENGCSVFVDADFRPYQDQWAFLAASVPMPAYDIEPIILRATGNAHPLDVTFIDEEDQKEPWKKSTSVSKKLVGPMPKSLTVTLANLIYFEKAQLPQSLANRLIRLAAFQNPEFYKKQAMRFSVWDEPRVIGCTENHRRHERRSVRQQRDGASGSRAQI